MTSARGGLPGVLIMIMLVAYTRHDDKIVPRIKITQGIQVNFDEVNFSWRKNIAKADAMNPPEVALIKARTRYLVGASSSFHVTPNASLWYGMKLFFRR
jgi:hypothetical protein